jgi:thioredoxin reductase (NADPH)
VERALANPKIVPVWNCVVEAVEGGDMVERLVLKNVRTEERSRLAVAGVFVFVGTEPNSEPVRDLLETREGGWIVTDEKKNTSVEGIFAAGDVRDTPLRQVVTAASDGAVAAMAAYEYITTRRYLQSVLMKPERVFALFYSAIDQEQLRLVSEAEASAKERGIPLVLVDGYRNLQMREVLGIGEMPALVEMRSGRQIRSGRVATLMEIRSFLEG